ncbi:MAG TPA: NUDIX domain-containing protein [Patescibacteria group bacterium]|nr:NUDIX domain-containing protein [Patescibacteria group bacterium]
MTKTVVDLTRDDDVRQLATPANILAGHEIFQKGEVAFAEFKPELINATVSMPGMNTRRTSFSVKDDMLRWKCTCTSNPKLFCKHLVVAALGVQKEGRGDIYKAAGVIIKDRKVLFERSQGKPAFIAPGGRIEAGETVTEALKRELSEEFQIDVDEADLEPFGTFSADAANHPSQQVHMQVFIVKKWRGEVTPASEVAEVRWLNSQLPNDIELGSIFAHEVVPRLKKEGLID